MLVEGKATFGNNVEVSVLNETGGREVPIYDGLSASLAYIIALYRHRPALIERLRDMITAYTEGIASTEGTVGDKVKIVNTGTIRNVKIGDYATIENSARLENGSVNSKREAPVFIGDSVIAQDFIVSSGAKIADAAKIIRCFIGQACQVTHNFSAHDSLLFSNCAFENGEACAIFAGPFTVSMHKSSLLIAGMYSFLNAGSGSNQSNHMYKLGPLHYGVMKRGCKTASGAHLVWPARIGAFSMVMGKVDAHVDLDAYPFSYVFGNDRSVQLVPGVNFASVGTYRDVRKWEARDKRKPCDGMLDYISTYSELNPYIISKIVKGRKRLEMLRRSQGDCNEYRDGNIVISRKALERGICLYNKIEQLYVVLSAVALSGFKKVPEKKYTEWVDMLGLIVPQEYVMNLCHDMEEEKIISVDDLCVYWKKWKEDYPLLLKQTIECHYTLDRVVEALMNYEPNIHCYYEALYADIRKEEELGDSSLSRISSGFVEMLQHDCDEQLKKAKERLSSLLKELK